MYGPQPTSDTRVGRRAIKQEGRKTTTVEDKEQENATQWCSAGSPNVEEPGEANRKRGVRNQGGYGLHTPAFSRSVRKREGWEREQARKPKAVPAAQMRKGKRDK